MPKCKHKNIIITVKKSYEFPNGWEKQKDERQEAYPIQEEEISTFCEDCGEYLDE